MGVFVGVRTATELIALINRPWPSDRLKLQNLSHSPSIAYGLWLPWKGDRVQLSWQKRSQRAIAQPKA